MKKKPIKMMLYYKDDKVRVPDPLPQEMGRGTNVFKSGEFFFSSSHSKKIVADREEWHQSGTGRISLRLPVTHCEAP